MLIGGKFKLEGQVQDDPICSVHHGHDTEQTPYFIRSLKNEWLSETDMSELRHTVHKISENPPDGIIPHLQMIDQDGEHFLVTDWFGGSILASTSSFLPLAIGDFLHYATCLARSIGSLHQHGAIHYALCPSNIYVSPATREIKITNLSPKSISEKLLQKLYDPAIQRHGIPYLAPEQTGRMNLAIDYRTDLYSLGIIYYELLIGAPPFLSSDPLETIHGHIARAPLSLSKLRKEIPDQIDAIVLKLLSKKAAERYQSGFSLLHDLEECKRQFELNKKVISFTPGRNDISSKLTLPEKLIGRKQELDTLLGSFDRVCTGSSAVLFVNGPSGMGKSSLINGIVTSVLERRGYFLASKYDLLTRNTPLNALFNIFNQLANFILSEPEKSIEERRRNIQKAVGESGRLISDLLPEYKFLIGEQPELPNLGPMELQNRFEYVILEFVRVLATKEHPLVIVLDDIQWAAITSLNMVRTLILEQSINHVLWILAYRDGEITNDHPLLQLKEDIAQHEIPSHALSVPPFTKEEANLYILETLHTTVDKSLPLAELLLAKTGGNPFFMGSFLRSVYEKGILTFTPEKNWVWDLDEIDAVKITDDVVHLVEESILALSEPAKAFLQMASCIGNSFSATRLARLMDISVGDILDIIEDTTQRGFIEQRARLYRFSHDQIQQAAYSSLPENERLRNHHKIGLLYLASKSQGTKDSVFAIVNQLNLVLSEIENVQERDELASLNLLAGIEAISSGAYANALSYFESGIKLLNRNSWSDRYQLTYSLHEHAAYTAYLARDFTKMHFHGELVLTNAHSALEKARTYDIFIQAAQQQLGPVEAIRISLKALRDFGIFLSRNTSLVSLILKYFRVKRALGSMKVDDLKNLPKMTDPKKKAAIRIMVRAGIPAYIVSPRLFMKIAFERMSLILENGLSDESSLVFCSYASFECGFRGNIDLGQKYGNAAIEISKLVEHPESDAYSKLIFFTLLNHWTTKYGQDLKQIMDLGHYCTHIGAFTTAGPFFTLWGLHAFVSGTDLLKAEKTGAELAGVVSKFQLHTQLLALNTIRKAFHDLIHEESAEHPFQGELLPPEEVVEIFAESNVKLGVYIVWTLKTIVCCIFGNFVEASQYAQKALSQQKSAIGMSLKNVFFFYNTLIGIKLADASGGRKKRRLIRRARQRLKTISRLRKYAPDNYAHKEELIRAELGRLSGEHESAIFHYEKAISLAHKSGFTHDAGLACELAAEAMPGLHLTTMAQQYLESARQYYKDWNAWAKVRQLETKYESLLKNPIHALAKKKKRNVDYTLVAGALQSISKEIRTDSLLESVISALVSSCDATKAQFLAVRNNDLYLEASQTLPTESKVQLVSKKIHAQADIFHSIIEQVRTTSKLVLVDNAEIDPTTRNAAYVKKHGVKSILCLPVKRKPHTVGLLYLENNLKHEAFGADTIDILTLLASQVAISLENAKLYDEIIESEKNNRDLSASLGVSNKEYRQTLSALLTSKERLSLAIQGAGVGLWEFDLKTNRIEFNARLAELHGIGEYLLEMDIGQLKSQVHPEDFENFASVLKKHEVGQNPYFEMEYRVKCQNKDWRWLFLRGHISKRDQSGVPLTATGILLDIDPMKTAEEQKTELEKEILQQQKIESIGQLTGGIAHDLNNLITPILGYADLLKEELSYNKGLVEDVEEIRDAGKRARDLIGQLLAFGRKQVLELSILDLNDVIVDFERILRGVINNQIELHISLGALRKSIRGDLSQLQQVLLNLVVNARDALPNGGEIFIETRNQNVDGSHPPEIADLEYGPYVHLIVRDTGTGMDWETQKKIFEPFYTTKEVGRGTGLGLSTVYGIMKQHNGNIYVKSNPGRGTQFDLYFPIDQNHGELTSRITSHPPDATLGHETVLVVEDEKGVRKLVTTILKKRGYHVITASNGSEALEAAKQHQGEIDLLLTDVVMPKMKGPEVYKILHQGNPSLRVLYMTGYAYEDFVHQEMAREDFRVLTKPFTPDLLHKTVREVLDGFY